MKTIEEIEKLSLDELERISLDESIPVPFGLEERIGIPAMQGRRRMLLRLAGIAASLVLIGGLALTLRPKPLQDTFDDPLLAYAEVQKTFRQISDKMNVGLELASEARTTAEKPAEILKKINE